MSFLRVNDLHLVCIVQNHDADFAVIYHLKYVFIDNRSEIAVGKVCPLVVEGFGILVPSAKAENDVNFVSAYGSHYAQIWLKCVDIKIPPLFYLVCLRSFGALSGWAYP